MGKKKRKRIRLHEATHENDIRYLGPLNYQHFQILGWVCIVITQAVLLLNLGCRLDPGLAEDAAGIAGVLGEIGSFSLPFLLIANFARVLNATENYKKQLIKNAGAMVGIALLFIVMLYRYVIGGISGVLEEPGQAANLVQTVMGTRLHNGFLAFNIFVDLFLCTLVMLFLNYRPKKFFRGKSVLVFRLFALLPIGYEIFCMILKISAAEKLQPVPLWFNALMPVKPIMTFVLFLLLALFVKTREIRFRRHGKTHEEYLAFLKTRRNSRNFSIFLAAMLVVVSLMDIGLMFAYSFNNGLNSVGERFYTLVETMLEEKGFRIEDAEKLAAGTTDPEGNGFRVTEKGEEVITGKAGETETAGQAEGSAEKGSAETLKPASEEDINAVISDIGAEELAEMLATDLIGGVAEGARISLAIGIGGSVSLVFMAPLVLLFSYTRKPKNEKFSRYIPLAGIAVIIVLYLEGIRMALFRLPIGKLSTEKVQSIIESFSRFTVQDPGLK